jgi:eukaryotic-like serine/threonine-protein kinase
MNRLKTLIQEIHRRSLWQVLGIFLAGSWGVIQVVDVLTERVGLPDWTPTMAVVLLLIGLPVVLATAFVQEGMTRTSPAETEHQSPADSADNLAPGTGSLDRPSTRPSAGRRLLTWRNAMIGGVGAFTLLGISLMAYFAMWTSGIGPVGNLVAQGVLEERDPIVLATFSDATGEGFGDVITEALRVDLLESPVLSIVPAGRLRQVLRLMERPANGPLPAELAREVALREGYKAIIQGDVASLGDAYVISAAVVAAESGDQLKAFRVTARSESELVDAVDKLSQDIREGAGESLRNIRAGAPLERATTSSFAALRDLTEAERAEERGDDEEALRLLADAVARDTAFAMAYRKIAVIYYNTGTSPDAALDAATRAFRHRARLTERERFLTEAYYHSTVTGDMDAQVAAYRSVLRVAPDDGAALNNLSLVLGRRGEFDEAIALLVRAVALPSSASSVAMANLVFHRLRAGDVTGALESLGAYEAAYPSHSLVHYARIRTLSAAGEVEALHALADSMAGGSWTVRDDRGLMAVGFRDAAAGAWREATGHFAMAARVDSEEGRPYQELTSRVLALIAGGRLIGGSSYGRDSVATMTAAFEAVDASDRPWAHMVVYLAGAGDVVRAQRVFDAWPEELFAVTRAGQEGVIRPYAAARLLLAQGDAEGGARALEALRRDRRCPVCYRPDLAEAYGRLGRTVEAIALLEPERSTLTYATWPLNRVLAARHIAPLYEAAADTAAAVEAYQAFAEAWSNADPQLQPQVRHARERIRALGG